MSLESLPPSAQPNHFNLIRMLAASAVIVSHSFGLAANRPDPLQQLTSFDLGTTAVIAFFAISGYFISLSFERRHSNAGFVLARVTRIVPALLICSLVTAFLVGPLFTALAAVRYFSDTTVWLYPVQVTSVIRVMAAQLPQMFASNPHPYEVNTSLWTLFYEVACYAGLFLAGLLGVFRRFGWFLVFAVGLYIAGRYGPWRELHQFAIFGLPFLLGMVAYRYRVLKAWLALSLVALAVGLTIGGAAIEPLWSLAVGYGVLWLGFAPAPALLAYNRVGDYSYGTYIYGFLVQQMVAALIPGITPGGMIALALPLAIGCGALSWYLVERPALGLRKGLSTGRTVKAAHS